jgi:hydroxymethylbilane synthase
MPMTPPLRIATRSSPLALAQAEQVRAAFAARGVQAELVTYTTVGDRVLDQPLSRIGEKGLFTQELEADLLEARVDLCVHSLKDLPTASPDGIAVVATLPREDPRDALVTPPGSPVRALSELPPGARVGSSSLRRRAQLAALRPDMEVVDLRGNVGTRLRKVDAGEVDAAILAAAGLHRLDLGARIVAYLEPPAWLPAAGQGAIALQVRRDDRSTRALVTSLNDAPTWAAVQAERAFLAALEGGCQVPIGALVVAGTLHGVVASLDGAQVVRGERRVDPADPAGSGAALAARVESEGASAILAAIRAAD